MQCNMHNSDSLSARQSSCEKKGTAQGTHRGYEFSWVLCIRRGWKKKEILYLCTLGQKHLRQFYQALKKWHFHAKFRSGIWVCSCYPCRERERESISGWGNYILIHFEQGKEQVIKRDDERARQIIESRFAWWCVNTLPWMIIRIVDILLNTLGEWAFGWRRNDTTSRRITGARDDMEPFFLGHEEYSKCDYKSSQYSETNQCV